MHKKRKRIPNHITKCRETQGYSTKQVTKLIDLKSEQTLKNWEAGKSVPRNAEYLFRLMAALNVTEYDLYGPYIDQLEQEMIDNVAKMKKQGKIPKDFQLP